MKRIAYAALALAFSSGTALADYTLVCKSEWSGGGLYQEIVVEGANSFNEACDVVENDPQYNEWRDCLDGAGEQGKCANRNKQ